jgi:serine protease
MLKTGMRHFFYRILLVLSLGGFLPGMLHAQSNVVAHGLILQLKPGATGDFSREQTTAAKEANESKARERMAAISKGTGVSGYQDRALSGDHRLMRFDHTLQGQELEDTMRRLRLHPDVASVEPNVRIALSQTPNDTNFPLQWHLGSNSNALQYSALNMTNAWATTTGTAVVVAVVDTGVRPNHPDLAGKLLSGYDFIEDVDNANDGNGRDNDPSDPGDWVTSAEARTAAFAGCTAANSSWHGTFIAAQIAAATNNSLGVAGMNWNAKVLPVRVSGKCGALLSDIFDGMRWAAGLSVDGVPANANPARVINLSFGGDQACSASYQAVIDEITAAGTLIVVAAGNKQDSTDNMQLKRPADCQRVMAVGAVQANGLKTDYSYVGSTMALMAPGGHGLSTSTTTLLLSASNNGTQGPTTDSYGYKAGTSFSAPLAVGAASLMLAINPSLSPDALIARMKSSARAHQFLSSSQSCSTSNQVACNCNTSTCGAGVLDPAAAIQASYAPAAVIAPVGKPGLGATVTLDGRASAATDAATITSYAWSLVAGSGVSIPNATASVTQVVLPATAGNFVFKLQVTDSLGRQGEAQLSITTEAAVASDSGGGGADRWLWLMLLILTGIAFSSRFLKKKGWWPAYSLR